MSAAAGGLLLVDLGNRHVKLADADGRVSQRVTLDPAQPAAAARDVASALRACAPHDRACLASVAPRWRGMVLDALQAAGLPARELGVADVPLRVLSEGTGVDRLLGAWQAHAVGGGAALVISLGTAFTVDAVDASGAFHGGAIGPGLGVQVAALAAAAPHLPAPAPAWPAGGVIPADSAAAIACGTRGALAAGLRSLAADFARALPEAPRTRIVTGGDAAQLAPLLGPEWRLEPDLVLAALARLSALRAW